MLKILSRHLMPVQRRYQIKKQQLMMKNLFKQVKDIMSDINLLEELLEMITPALTQLTQDFIDAFEDYIDETADLERLKFAVFIIGLVVVFCFIWIPYLRNLSNKIFRTKGMLNMIPMDIISKNESLKNLFISGDLLQAVK